MTTAFFSLLGLLMLAAVVNVASQINVHKFDGRPWQFISLALYWSLVGAGAACFVAGEYSTGGKALIAALVLRAVTDRRRGYHVPNRQH
jgi:hypothetical protein